jgi:hypothetical protein
VSIFTKKKDRVTVLVDDLMAIERERRQWCIAQACCLDETRSENIIATAEKIYEYVWGAHT